MAHQLNLNTEALEELKAKVAALPAEKKIQVSKSVTPGVSAQTVEPDSGYDGLSAVTVEKIPSDYVIPTGEKSITANGTHDVAGFASVNVAVESGGGSGANINTLNMVIEGTADYVQLGYTKATNNELVITYEDTTRTFTDIAQNTFVMITVDPDEENSNAVWVDLVNEYGNSYFTLKPYVPILMEAPKAENGNTRTLRITYKHH